MTMVYQFAHGSRLNGNAQAIGEALAAIREQRGRLTADLTVAAAKAPDSPLHHEFEWDDAKAAYEHRLNQARYVIRSVVVLDAEEDDPQPVRAFARVQLDDGGSYEPIDVVIRTPEFRQQVLADVRRELDALRRKLSAIESLGDVLAALERVDAVAKAKQDEFAEAAH